MRKRCPGCCQQKGEWGHWLLALALHHLKQAIDGQIVILSKQIDLLPEILEILIISCSTSSSLLLRRRPKEGWVLGKGTGLEVSLSVSSKLWSSISEPLLTVGTVCEETHGRHLLSVAPGTRFRVTKIEIPSHYQ